MEITEKITESVPEEADIAAFEKEISSMLPEDYKIFLRTHNGGRPSPSAFAFQSASCEADSSVHYFFGLHDGRIGNLKRGWATYRGRVPDSFLPVATDSFGDHELEDDSDPFCNVSPISASFSEFISSLT